MYITVEKKIGRRRGVQNPTAKLTDSQVREIRKALELGTATSKELTFKYSVSKSTISQIKHGRVWQHVI